MDTWAGLVKFYEKNQSIQVGAPSVEAFRTELSLSPRQSIVVELSQLQ